MKHGPVIALAQTALSGAGVTGFAARGFTNNGGGVLDAHDARRHHRGGHDTAGN